LGQDSEKAMVYIVELLKTGSRVIRADLQRWQFSRKYLLEAKVL